MDESTGVPEAFSDINLPNQLFSGGAEVTATNFALVLALALVLLIGGTLFNVALEEHGSSVRLSALTVPGPISPVLRAVREAVRDVLKAWANLIPGETWVDRAAAPVALLAFTALIYGFLQPGFGFNQPSLIVLLSLVVSKWLLTTQYVGGKALMVRRFTGTKAGMKLFPACIVIALVSVVISRLGNLQPGFVIGFVAGVSVLDRRSVDPRKLGRASGIASAVSLLIGISAWLGAVPLHALAQDHPGFWTRLGESVALSVFVVSVDGLMFSLIPLKFMDGAQVWQWSKRAWFLLFIPTAFLFVQVLFNDSESYTGLFARARSVSAIAVLACYGIVTFGTWAYFRRISEREPESAQLEAAAGE